MMGASSQTKILLLMKTSTITTVTTAIFLSCLVSAAQAKGSWWEKLLGNGEKDDTELSVADLNLDDISGAFKQALTKGANNVVAQLGQNNGFNADSAIHIPLPKNLKKIKNILEKIGMSRLTDELEIKLNRAAEIATPIAKDLFVQSIKDMTFEDVKKIYNGPNDSATQYFKQKMSHSLAEKMNPIVDKSLSEVGAVQALNAVMDKYGDIPFVKSVKPDLTGHVVQKGMDGIFYYLAKQEAQIRKDPLKQTTELLKKVFGG